MSTAYLQTFTRVIQPGQTEQVSASGTVFKCKQCSLPTPFVQVSFGDNSTNSISSGDTFNLGIVGASFTHVALTNTHATLVATVTFQVGSIVVSFNPPDNKLASTYAKGNLGLTASGNYVSDSGVSQAVTISSNYISISNSGSLTVFGTDGGRQRKLIIFSVSGDVNTSTGVFDVNGCLLFTLPNSQPPVAVETDATLKLKSIGGSSPSKIIIGEIYFSQS
jgi:hypothetical protein